MTDHRGGYVLIEDDDGHWYVCPSGRQPEAEAHFGAVGRFWAPGSSHEGEPPEMPEWLVPVGGAPSLVEFLAFAIRGEVGRRFFVGVDWASDDDDATTLCVYQADGCGLRLVSHECVDGASSPPSRITFPVVDWSQG